MLKAGVAGLFSGWERITQFAAVAWKRTHAAWNSIILQGKLLEATSLLFVATVIESLVTRKRTTQRS